MHWHVFLFTSSMYSMSAGEGYPSLKNTRRQNFELRFRLTHLESVFLLHNVRLVFRLAKAFGNRNFLNIFLTPWSLGKSAFKKIFECYFKDLRSKLLSQQYFSQYPGDPSFCFLCKKNFFEQRDFFPNFFGNFIVVRKK